jgi:hypothetical protein
MFAGLGTALRLQPPEGPLLLNFVAIFVGNFVDPLLSPVFVESFVETFITSFAHPKYI